MCIVSHMAHSSARRSVFRHSRQVKAESLVYQQRRATPYEMECIASAKPRRGDILIPPFQGWGLWCVPFRRALPCAGLSKAFSLSLTAMAFTLRRVKSKRRRLQKKRKRSLTYWFTKKEILFFF